MKAAAHAPLIWMILSILLCGCDRSPGATQSAPTAVAQVPLPETRPGSGEPALPVYEIRMGQSALAALERSAFSNERQPASFVANGKVHENAQIRHRGAWARGWPKKPLKVFFDENDLFEGQDRVNLNSGWRDPAFVREVLAYHIYSVCGAPASKARVVRVTMNGQFLGLYIDAEQPDKPLLRRYNLKGAAIYKANSDRNVADERDLGSLSEFARHYEKQTQKKEGHDDLQKFCHELASATNIREFFEASVDLEKYINYLAATVLAQNWDGYNKNHFLVHDVKGSGKWFPLPWDLDRTLGDHWNQTFDEASLPILLGTRKMPGITGWNRLQDRFFSDPALTARFLDRLEELLKSEFTTEKLFPVLDLLEEQIKSDASAECQRWRRSERRDFRKGIAQVKRFIEDRRAYLLRKLPRLRSEAP